MFTAKSFFIVCIFWTLSYLLCGLPIYETNDDTVMSMLCGGAGFSSIPNEHILYSHYWVGLCLKQLYSLRPDLCWYGAYLLLAQILSGTIITSVFLKKHQTSTSLALILAFLFVAVFLRPCLLFQFTTTAALTTAAGCIVWLENLERPKRDRLIGTAGGLFFVVTGSLIRSESALLVLVLTAVYLLARALFSSKWKIFWRGILTTTIGVIAVLAVRAQNEAYYAHNEGWRDFYVHNQYAFNLLASQRLNPQEAAVRSALKQTGWLPVDVEMFKSWGYLNDKLYSSNQLKFIDEHIGMSNPSSVPLVLELFRERIMNRSLIAMHLTILFSLVFCCTRLSLLRSAGLYLATIVSLIIAIMSTKYLPVHVYSAVAGTTVLFGLYSLPPEVLNTALKNRKVLAAALAMILAITGFCATSFHEHSAALDIRRANLIKSLQELQTLQKRALICWTSLFPYELIRPFDSLPTYFRDLKLIGVNYMVRTPINRKAISDLGIDDLFNELDTPGIYLVVH